METRTKLALSVYALLYAAAAMAAFRLGGVVPVPTVYVLIGLIYAIPIWLAVTGRVGPWLGAALLVATPFLPALIVVDPLEVGFYGYDPYVTLRDALEFQTIGPIRLAQDNFAWPGFYAFLWVVTYILDLPVETVGKYLPLITIVTPVLLFIFARRLISTKTAFLAAMGFAGVRTLYTFQVKFIDETTAFVMFFALLVLLVIRADGRNRSMVSYLTLAIAIGAVLTHHYVGALVGLFLVLWDLSHVELNVPNRLNEVEIPISRVTVVTGVIFVAMFLVVAPQFIGFLTSVADFSPSIETDGIESPNVESPNTSGQNGPQSGSDGDPSEENMTTSSNRSTTVTPHGPNRVRQLLIANVVIVGVLGIVLLGFRFWTIQSESAILAGGIFGCALTIGYAYSVTFGPILPLDPSRYLVYMVGLLLVSAGYVLERSRIVRYSNSMLVGAVSLIIITQMALVSPMVMYSNQSEASIGEDHYSLTQFAVGNWLAKYGGERVVGYERYLWRYNDIAIKEIDSSDFECGTHHVWRRGVPSAVLKPTHLLVYDSGSIKLYDCRGG